jgi:RNA polymerase sigma-70 factor (ECF subfamily)
VARAGGAVRRYAAAGLRRQLRREHEQHRAVIEPERRRELVEVDGTQPKDIAVEVVRRGHIAGVQNRLIDARDHGTPRLNKPTVRQTQFRVGRTGATPAQLEALYRERFEQFVRVAGAICRDVELGRDAVQTGFAVALRKRRAFRGSGRLEAWVWRIVVNEARRIRRRDPVDSVASTDVPTTNGTGGDELGIRAWVAALPERQREALFLRYYADLDYRTIAAVLGIEVGTVSATLATAHRALRKKLEEVRR